MSISIILQEIYLHIAKKVENASIPLFTTYISESKSGEGELLTSVDIVNSGILATADTFCIKYLGIKLNLVGQSC